MFELISVLLISLTAFTFSEILIQDGELFSGYLNLLERLLFMPSQKARAFDDSILLKVKIKIIKIFGGCSKCMAGQMALWYFMYYGYWNHVLFIGLIMSAIFITYILQSLNKYGKTNNEPG